MNKFNKYSLALIGMYILSFIVMEYGSRNWIEGLYSLPIILLVVLWSENITGYLKTSDNQPANVIFYTDLFIINYRVC